MSGILTAFAGALGGGAVTGSNLVWICGGSEAAATLKTACQTYNVSSGVVAAADTMDTARMAGNAGSNNSNKGVISHGYDIVTGIGYTDTTQKVTLPGGTWSNGAAVANSSGRMGGGTTSGTVLFGALSDNPADNNTTNKTEKYVFAADTSGAGSTLTNSYIARSGAHGDALAAFTFGGSGPVSTVEKYTYSGDSVAAATSLGASVSHGYAAGNATYAYVGNHGNAAFTAMRKYTMATQTDAAGTALSQTVGQLEGAGSTNAKMLITGGTTDGTLTVVYTFSGDTTANGTAITSAYRWPACFAEAPGGLN